MRTIAMPTIYDNIENKLHKGLNSCLDKATRADFCIGYFNLWGWNMLLEQVNKLSGACLPDGYGDEEDDSTYYCRVLIGMEKNIDQEMRDYFTKTSTMDNALATRLRKKQVMHFRDQLTLGHPSDSVETALRKLSRQLRSGIVKVKLHLRHPLHAKLYLIHREDYATPTVGFLGSSNLTFSGISQQGELNVDIVEQDAAKKLSRWFQDRWDDQYSLDISLDLADVIDESWATEKDFTPYQIYMKVIYHLSREARMGIQTFELNQKCRENLLDFQANAVKVAAHHLHKRGGVMIGDVVGLGKTITATALAKIFEDDFGLETLIICPKNLTEMWEGYAYEYQLRAKVMSVTRVQVELPRVRRYRLVIVDESHNLRNSEGRRYQAIKEYILQNESKVILLTATPYNKSYHDLGDQLGLFISEEANLGISPERYIESIGGITEFQAKHQTNEYTLAAFQKSPFSDDWNELMRLFLVRRTRSFIKNNYTVTGEDGKKYLLFPDGSRQAFPNRLPRKVDFSFSKSDVDDQYAKMYSGEVIDIIDRLRLPRYGLGQEAYIEKAPETPPSPQEKRILENLGHAGVRLLGFARTGLFKRLESSGYSFILSVQRQFMRNAIFLYAIENGEDLPLGKNSESMLNMADAINDDDSDRELFEFTKDSAEDFYNHLKRVKSGNMEWIRSSLFSKKLRIDLKYDNKLLKQILDQVSAWDPAKDRKLKALKDLCGKKHGFDKLLIFTQYSDTADYLYQNMKDVFGDDIAEITGATENPTAIVYQFSPASNKKQIEASKFKPGKEIRIIIATDVISEGQNLQDAHIIVNYDLPWAIIRLIQRAGRVDRIGQVSEDILCYSFLPEDGIESIINLRGRLQQRIKENAETIGSDEVFFEGDPINIKDLYNEKAGIFDDDEGENDVDLASYAYQEWKNAIELDPSLETGIPKLADVIYSTKQKTDDHPSEGVIVYTKTDDDTDSMIWMAADGKVVTHSHLAILKALRCLPSEPIVKPRLEKHHELTENGLSEIQEQQKNSVGGQLGKQNGARYRVYHRLKAFMDDPNNGLWVSDGLKKAFDDIYRYPLRDYAKEAIGRQLRTGIDDFELIELVESLRENHALSLINEDYANRTTEPKILCTMGIKKG